MQFADLILVSGLDEPALNDPALASDIKRFEALLGDAGGPVGIVCCAANAPDLVLVGHYIVTVAPVAGGALLTAIAGWLKARFGRKISLRIGDIEAQASSIAEVELLLAKAKAFRADQSAL